PRARDPGRAPLPTVSLPVPLLTDRTLIATDVVVALALVATIPPGEWSTNASNDRLTDLCRFKQRAIQESLVRLQDAGWFAVTLKALAIGAGRARTVVPLWLPPDAEDVE